MSSSIHTTYSNIARILSAALQAANPYTAVASALRWTDPQTLACYDAAIDMTKVSKALVLGAGKASPTMVASVCKVLQSRPPGAEPLQIYGALVTKYEHLNSSHMEEIPKDIKLMEAAHPVPDDASSAAGAALLELSQAADPDNTAIFFVLSGGASALMSCPAAGISMEDLKAMNSALLRCGADITQINTLRKHCSKVSGGQLAAATTAKMLTMVLSDVIGDRLDTIGSGPTVPDPTTFADCARIVDKLHLNALLPESIRQHLALGLAGHVADTPKLISADHHSFIIGSNSLAVKAAADAARACGYTTSLQADPVDGDVAEVAAQMARTVVEITAGRHELKSPCCLIQGGEVTVNLGSGAVGEGGRNQELPVIASLKLLGLLSHDKRELPQSCVFAALGTDGTDGPTNAAGGVIAVDMLQLALQRGVAAHEYANRHDTYNFYKRCDALAEEAGLSGVPGLICPGGMIVTGPTGTNVMDVYVTLIE